MLPRVLRHLRQYTNIIMTVRKFIVLFSLVPVHLNIHLNYNQPLGYACVCVRGCVRGCVCACVWVCFTFSHTYTRTHVPWIVFDAKGDIYLSATEMHKRLLQCTTSLWFIYSKFRKCKVLVQKQLPDINTEKIKSIISSYMNLLLWPATMTLTFKLRTWVLRATNNFIKVNDSAR